MKNWKSLLTGAVLAFLEAAFLNPHFDPSDWKSWARSGGVAGCSASAVYPGEMYIGTNTAKPINFYTTTATTVRMYIASSGEVGIGTTSPSTKAILDLTSTTKGFLPPRMTTTQRDAITSPVAGLMIYNTTTNKLNIYTTAWEAVISA